MTGLNVPADLDPVPESWFPPLPGMRYQPCDVDPRDVRPTPPPVRVYLEFAKRCDGCACPTDLIAPTGENRCADCQERVASGLELIAGCKTSASNHNQLIFRQGACSWCHSGVERTTREY